MSRCMQCGSKECYSSNCGDSEFEALRENVDDLESEIERLKVVIDSNLDWIVNRAVELARVMTVQTYETPEGEYSDYNDYFDTPEEILEQIKKELGER